MAAKDRVTALLESDQSLVLDGGLATELEAHGHDLSSALWSATILENKPEAIYDVHLDYFRAGADIAITASYQATPLCLEKYLGFNDDQSAELVRKSVKLAQQARDAYLKETQSSSKVTRTLLVAGSVGPYGAYLANGAEYTGDYSLSNEVMKDFHRGRISALIDAGADLLACETMPSLSELEALLQLLREEFPTTLAWVSCTLRDREHLSDGTALTETITLVAESDQVLAFGVNCIPEQDALPALEYLRPLIKKPLVVYPNSGETWDAKKRKWFGSRVEGQSLEHITKEWHKTGARLIGGCCRTTPSDIRVIRQTLDSTKS